MHERVRRDEIRGAAAPRIALPVHFPRAWIDSTNSTDRIMNTSASIPVVLCVDVEPDKRRVDVRARLPWRGFALTQQVLDRLRSGVARTSPDARFSWYFRIDPQVERTYGSAAWIVETNPALMDALRAAGDDFGLHVHAYRWDASRNGWVMDYGDPEWIDSCLTLAFSAFESSVGTPCTLFRFGDHWMDQRTFERLAALGVEIDLTIEPGHDAASPYRESEPFTGVLPDYRSTPSYPYRPSDADFRVPDGTRHDGIWELPVTTAPVQPPLAYRVYHRWISGRPPVATSTALVSAEPSVFARIIDEALGRPNPHLVLALHSGAVTTTRHAARIETNLSVLLKRPEASRFAWVTPRAAIERLQPSSARSALIDQA